MATGDPYCPTHGYTPCKCMETGHWPTVVPGFWVGDNKAYSVSPPPSYDLLYRPTYYTQPFTPYTDTTEVYYTIEQTRIEPHTRWSRMLICIEETWEDMMGIKVPVKVTHCANSTTIIQIESATNYSSNKIIWSNT